MPDHPVTEESEKRLNMTIVLDNGVYLTCMVLGLITAKCDFRNAANQEKLKVSPGEEKRQEILAAGSSLP